MSPSWKQSAKHDKLNAMSRRHLLLLLWLLSDLFLFIAAFSGAYFLRVGLIFSSDFPFDRYLTAAILSAPVWLLVLIASRMFSLMHRQASLRSLSSLVYAAIIAIAFFGLTYYFLYGLFFSRLLLLQAFLLLTLVSVGWHLFFGFLSRGLLRGAHPAFPTLIVGATREAADLIRSMNRNRSALTPVAILDGRGIKESNIEGVPVLGKLNKLEEVLSAHRISHLIQASELEQSINLLSACRMHGITYLLLPSVLGIVEHDERVEALEGRSVTVVRPNEPWYKWFFR